MADEGHVADPVRCIPLHGDSSLGGALGALPVDLGR
jgi:hypothetical protein